MKKLFLIAGLMAAFVLAVASVSASGAPNFAGTWVLDKSKSQGLDQRMQNAESVTCVITQDDKTLTMDWKIAGGQTGGPGSGTGGGGGTGRGPSGPRTYNLDGKEVMSEGQMGNSSMKATWANDTSSLELMTVRSGNRDGQDFKFTTTDKLSLSADGKVLTINRHSESARGTTDSTLVFNKQ
jgi:hypothetical protein